MKILVKCKAPFKIIEARDYNKIKDLLSYLTDKYDIKAELKNFKIDHTKQ